MSSPVYFKAGLASHITALRDPCWDRLRLAGPWALGECLHPTAGRGCMIWWSDKQQPDPAKIKWRSDAEPDGLWYAAPDALPDQADLAKRDSPAGIDVQTLSGHQITIPLAAAAPRKISFSKRTASDPATDFGRSAQAIFDRLSDKSAKVMVDDPDVISLVTLAIMLAYRVTPELLDDLGWITTADVDHILCAIWGSDPKALNPAGVSLPSPVGA